MIKYQEILHSHDEREDFLFQRGWKKEIHESMWGKEERWTKNGETESRSPVVFFCICQELLPDIQKEILPAVEPVDEDFFTFSDNPLPVGVQAVKDTVNHGLTSSLSAVIDTSFMMTADKRRQSVLDEYHPSCPFVASYTHSPYVSNVGREQVFVQNAGWACYAGVAHVKVGSSQLSAYDRLKLSKSGYTTFRSGLGVKGERMVEVSPEDFRRDSIKIFETFPFIILLHEFLAEGGKVFSMPIQG